VRNHQAASAAIVGGTADTDFGNVCHADSIIRLQVNRFIFELKGSDFMLQEITIKTNASESLKPLVEAAIRNQVKVLQHGVQRTKERIAEFEKRAGMSSAEFEQKLLSDQIEETIEAIDWNMELAALRLLESQYQSLSEAEID
jgi:hypothetical protein